MYLYGVATIYNFFLFFLRIQNIIIYLGEISILKLLSF